jgi:type IV secretory pathway VirB4 component
MRRHRSTAGSEPATLLPGLPHAVQVHGQHLTVADTVTTTLAVTGYPAEVGAGWLEPLLSYPGRLDVAVHIDPIAGAVAADQLRKQRARLESTRRAAAGNGKLDDPGLDAAAEDAAKLAALLARGHARLFSTGIYLTVHADTTDELTERVAEVRSLAASLLIDLAPATWRQLHGWTTGLPLAYDALHVHRTFDTAALAASFPFASADLPVTDSPTAILYGLNLASAGVVVWDRWAQDNHNAVILARSGAGKSYLAKLDLLRNLYLGVEAFVIDPEDEYLALADAVGGTIIRAGEPGVRINPFDMHPGDGTDALLRRAMFLHTVVAVLLGGDDTAHAVLDRSEADALDIAVMAAYRAKGITTDARTWRRLPPTMADLHTALTSGGPAGQSLAARLRPYVSGSFSGLLNGPTTTTAHGHLVVYAIKGLPDEMKPVGTLLILDAIWRTISANTTGDLRRMVLVDEAWLLLRAGLAAKYLFRLAKSARKYLTGLTVVSQDAADVLGTDIGRAVVSNSATQILLRQAPQAIEAVAEAFGLTDGERAMLLSAARGEALLAGAGRVAFTAQASDVEHALCVSRPTA